MALSKLSADAQGIILGQLCNALEPRLAVYLSSTSHELRLLLTPALVQQLRADYEAAKALCWKAGRRSCKDVREAKRVVWCGIPLLSATEMATLGTLGSVLPALEELCLENATADPDGVQRLAAGLGAGALPALSSLDIFHAHMGDAGASALAAALGRGALPRLKTLGLSKAGIGDAGLVALGLPSLESIYLAYNPLGEEGLAALVAPPPLAGALSLTIRVLTKLKLPTKARVLTKLEVLDLGSTQINNAGCAALASALYGGTLPALKRVNLEGIPASAASKAAVIEALAKSRGYGGFRFYRAIRNFCALYECFEDVARGHNIFAWLWMTAHIFAALALLAAFCLCSYLLATCLYGRLLCVAWLSVWACRRSVLSEPTVRALIDAKAAT